MNADDFVGWALGIFMSLLSAIILFVIVWAVKDYVFNDRVCKVYSEPILRRGAAMVGNSYYPTTYTSRDCLVWQEE